MEILDAAEACFMVGDDLLDFTLAGEAEEDYDFKTSYSSSSLTATAAFGDESLRGSFSEFAEEELEWLSNKDEFPAVETCFGILSDNPGLLVNHHSPSSVLENNSNSSGRNGGGGTSASCCGGLKVPVRPRSSGRRPRRMWSYSKLPDQAMWLGQVTMMLPRMLTVGVDGGGARMGRRCLHCHSDKTPQWRAGPMGPKTLCNACGVRYKSGRLLPEYRPANSPTFSSKLHSNSHRRVVEMRRQTQSGRAM